MKKTLIKQFVSMIALVMLALPMLSVAVPAHAGDLDLWGGKKDDIQTGMGVGNKDPRDIFTSVINLAMGFLGLIAVSLILFGGFKWMTAQGNDKQTEDAVKIIRNGVIGLIIILAAFGVATFVVDSAMKATR